MSLFADYFRHPATLKSDRPLAGAGPEGIWDTPYPPYDIFKAVQVIF
jgi:hypothetical protein